MEVPPIFDPNVRQPFAGSILAVNAALAGICTETNPPVKRTEAMRQALNQAPHVKVYEGLPHYGWEENWLWQELERQDVTNLLGFPFYAPATETFSVPLSNTLADALSFCEYGGEKRCGGFHPDYAVQWEGKDGSPSLALICFGCQEVVFADGHHAWRYDLTNTASLRLGGALAAFRNKRPRSLQFESVRVEPALVSDASNIARTHVDAWRVAYHGHVPESLLDSLDVVQRELAWKRIISKAGHTVLVIRSGTQIFGFCDFGASRDADSQPQTAELYSIYVQPRHWHLGLGGLLLKAALDSAAQTGFTEIICWVLRTNQPALGFYEHHSFHPDGGEKNEQMDGSVLKEIRLRRRLT